MGKPSPRSKASASPPGIAAPIGVLHLLSWNLPSPGVLLSTGKALSLGEASGSLLTTSVTLWYCPPAAAWSHVHGPLTAPSSPCSGHSFPTPGPWHRLFLPL